MSSFFSLLREKYHHPDVYLHHLDELFSEYFASGIAPPHLSQELSTGDEGKLYAHVWEAILFRHLSSLGREFIPSIVRKAGQHGPDFGIVYGGVRIWIEAIVPSPKDIPTEWLKPPEVGKFRVKTMPHEAMLLRWTNALSTKKAKIDSYISKGIVGDRDVVVVAINSCRLSDCRYDDHGISQLPFAVETVFPIGPLAIPISRNGTQDGQSTRIARYSIEKKNGANIPTSNFLNPQYSRISGIVGCMQKHLLDDKPRLILVTNPLADYPVPSMALGDVTEYGAVKDGENFTLERVR